MSRISSTLKRRDGVWWAALFCLYLLAVLWLSWPLPLHLREWYVGAPGDAMQFYWSIWWFSQALFVEGKNPYWCSVWLHPWGANLAFHDYAVYRSVVALPLLPFLGYLGAGNVVFLAGFGLSGLITTAWIWWSTGNRWAGATVGVFYSFSAYHFARATGHFSLTEIQWFPLLLWGIERWYRRLSRLLTSTEPTPPPRALLRLSGPPMVAIAVTMQGYTHAYYLIFSLLILGLFLVCMVFGHLQRVKMVVQSLLWGCLTIGVSVGIGLFPYYYSLAQHWTLYMGEIKYSMSFAEQYSLLWRDYFCPRFRPGIPHWSEVWLPWGPHPKGEHLEYKAFLGYPTLILAFIGLLIFPDKLWRRLLCGMIVGALLLSLGPAWGLDQMLHSVPLLSAVRVPSRWGLVVLLGLIPLAGNGFAFLDGQIRRRLTSGTRQHPRLGSAVGYGMCGLLVLGHFLQFPAAPLLLMEPRPSSPHVELLKTHPLSGSVLSIPIAIPLTSFGNFHEDCGFQMEHGRKYVTGLPSRRAKSEIDALVSRPPYNVLLQISVGQDMPVIVRGNHYSRAWEHLVEGEVRFIQVRKDQMRPEIVQELVGYLHKIAQLEELFQDEKYLVYQVLGPAE